MMISRATTSLLLAATVSAAPLTPKEHVQPLVASMATIDCINNPQDKFCVCIKGKGCNDQKFDIAARKQCFCTCGDEDSCSKPIPPQPEPTPIPPQPEPTPIPAPTSHSITNPDSKKLKWVTTLFTSQYSDVCGVDSGGYCTEEAAKKAQAKYSKIPPSALPLGPVKFAKVLTGYLTVPLSYQPTDPGYGIEIELRVSAIIPAGNDESLPVILKHCGGPCSGDSCVKGGLGDAWSSKFNFLGITQRGVSDHCGGPPTQWPLGSPIPYKGTSTAVGGKYPDLSSAVDNFCEPYRTNYEAAAKYANGSLTSLKLSDLTTCPCDVPADGVEVPDTDLAGFSPFDESATAKHINFKYHQTRKCLKETDVFTIYNPTSPEVPIDYTQYVGTHMLSQDMNIFREAIGADKLGCDGGSYGTAVCSSWVAAFPQYAGKLLLNGNVASQPGVDDYFKSVAISIRQLMTKLIQICRGSNCFGDDVISPTEEFEALMQKIDADTKNHWALEDSAKKMFKLTSPIVFHYIVNGIEGGTGQQADPWIEKLTTITALKSNDATERLNAVKTVLEYPGVCPNWNYFGSCLGGLLSGVSMTDVVRAQDYASRFSVHSAVQIYKNLAHEYAADGIAVSRAMIKAGNLLTWPTEPNPATYGARANVKGIILSSLYDGATPYVNSKRMRDTLPSTSLVTWQGVGHCVGRANYDPEGVKRCMGQVAKYFIEDELPIDGFTCQNSQKIVEEEQLHRKHHVAKVRAARQQKLMAQ